jgi:hypothetical protein
MSFDEVKQAVSDEVDFIRIIEWNTICIEKD